jgi:hypothetical protein
VPIRATLIEYRFGQDVNERLMLTGKHSMSGYVKMGLLIGGAIIIATAMWIYFSPLQTCIRATLATLQLQGQTHGLDPGTLRNLAETMCSRPSR